MPSRNDLRKPFLSTHDIAHFYGRHHTHSPFKNHLQGLDYSVVQQCMHCGLCLPTCPTYDLTKLEKHSPRGRIALARAIADEELEVSPSFGEEMYYCLGCLACMTACPAGVNYAELFRARSRGGRIQGRSENPSRSFIRRWTIGWLSKIRGGCNFSEAF